LNQPAAPMCDFSTKAHRKEAWLFLETVWKGLEYLCKQVQREEKKRVAKFGKNSAVIDFGDQPGDPMVCNYFFWYASALYNFILVFQEAFSPSENLEGSEFREVLRWRHEVAAHALWALRKRASRKKQSKKKARCNKRDVAKQDMSIVLYPEFNLKFDGHFEVGGFCPEWQWGLVRTHERLKEIVIKYAPSK
jgi:hypothetical protein